MRFWLSSVECTRTWDERAEEDAKKAPHLPAEMGASRNYLCMSFTQWRSLQKLGSKGDYTKYELLKIK